MLTGELNLKKNMETSSNRKETTPTETSVEACAETYRDADISSFQVPSVTDDTGDSDDDDTTMKIG